jgi:protocatechuate 3,4-dioxygenase beta subunit
VLRGRVTRLDNGQPLRQVLITIAANDQARLPSTFTDNNGRFELAGLPASSYTITASKGGFVTLEYGQRWPFQPGRQVALAAAAVVEQLDFALPSSAVVTGRIVDEDGDPASHITVRVLRERYTEGRPLLSTRVALADVTDDRGEFRIYGIPPGTYYLSATRQMGRSDQLRARPAMGESTSFYPGAWSQEAAQRVTLAPGQVAALSFGLVPTPTARLTVVVRTTDGQVPRAPSQARVTLTTRIPGGDSPLNRTVGPDGSVSWDNLPPGEYLVSATVRNLETAAAILKQTTVAERAAGVAAARRTEDYASTRVQLDGTDARVDLTPLKPDIARGRITFDADAASSGTLRPEQVRVRVTSPDPLETTSTTLTAAQPNADWTFEASAPQGARLLRPSFINTTGWVVKSIRVGDADVTDTPLIFGGRDIEGITILLTDRLTEVSGVVRDGNGKPVDDATVVLFADDSDKWRYPSRFVAVVRADQSGRFSHRGLPPARYLAVALEFLPEGDETNPELIRRLQPAGARFALADREATTIDLRLSSLP